MVLCRASPPPPPAASVYSMQTHRKYCILWAASCVCGGEGAFEYLQLTLQLAIQVVPGKVSKDALMRDVGSAVRAFGSYVANCNGGWFRFGEQVKKSAEELDHARNLQHNKDVSPHVCVCVCGRVQKSLRARAYACVHMYTRT